MPPTDNIRLVNNLCLYDLLDDVFQCDKTKWFVEWVSYAFAFHPLDNGQVWMT